VSPSRKLPTARLAAPVLAAGLAALASLAGAASSTAHLVAGGHPCLIAGGQVESAVGLHHSGETPLIREAGPTGGVTYTRCTFFVWSGGVPKSQQQAVKNGTGALLVIETWFPAMGPNESSWDLDGYGPQVDQQVLGCKSVAEHPHGHNVPLPRDGAQGSYGAAGVAIGLNVCGVWHRDDTDRLITLTLKESQHRNAVKDLTAIAKIVLPKFW
jgi:hypothetical protein